MQNDTYNDEVLLDRLVDSELTDVERRRLLQSFDARPADWRRCALAFLEAQSWRKEMGQLARVSQPAVEERKPASPDRRNKSRWGAGVQWLAVAATVLLAFGLGWFERDRAVRLAGSTPTISDQVAVAPPNTGSASTGKPSDALTLYVRDRSGHMQPVQVPLVDAGTLDQQLGMQFQSALPEDVRNQLQSRGYNVQSRRQYAPLWLENGRPMIVPVEDTKIVPVGM